jgi:hypothetical protein
MNRATIAIGAVLGLLITGIVFHNANANCVNVYVDFGPLKNGEKIEECIAIDGEVNALDLLDSAGFTTEGTVEYGDAVLCRLNNLPDATTETCESMPPAESYWGVLVKEHQVVPVPLGITGAWGWAQTGIDGVYLNPGDSLGLVFADKGEVGFP